MKIKKIDIQNYRQFVQESICMEEKITFLAGANNSGKTSIIELMNYIFGEKSVKISVNDFPIRSYSKWIKTCTDLVRKSYQKNPAKEKFIEELQSFFASTENSLTEYEKQIEEDSMKIKWEVAYQDGEIIELFSPYLMDLDEKTYSFFFLYQYKFMPNVFVKNIDKQFDKCAEFLKDIQKGNNKREKQFVNLIARILENSYEEQYYYSDRNYTNLQKIEDVKKFLDLFHYKHILASRDMPDEKGDKKKKAISAAMIEFMGVEQWEDMFRGWPEEIMEHIESGEIKEQISAQSLEQLSDVINQISETNGGRSEKLVIESDVTYDDLKKLLQEVSHAKYMIGEYMFDEETQGLGYSNMIYMHLELQRYLKEMQTDDMEKKVHFFVIEEPEAHMHPQMQKEFVRYLLEKYENQEIQGIVTTHSSEVVRVAGLPALRVVRKKEDIFEKRICDMHQFLEDMKEKDANRQKTIENEYNFLFQVNYADIIFADKIIMFEGDTERMYLKRLLQRAEYRTLESQYIAFVQVGGAYTHWYRELIEYLQIKTLIFTDIDYEKAKNSISKIKKSYTSNGGIKKYYCTQVNKDDKEKVQIEDLYEWQDKGANKIGKYIMVSFQGEADGYTRTLEEAMLAKLFHINVEDKFTITEWEAKKKESGIDFKIPSVSKLPEDVGEDVKESNVEKESDKVGVREIIDKTSGSKTDFMYSVIVGEKEKEMLPHYIEEGLVWLME